MSVSMNCIASYRELLDHIRFMNFFGIDENYSYQGNKKDLVIKFCGEIHRDEFARLFKIGKKNYYNENCLVIIGCYTLLSHEYDFNNIGVIFNNYEYYCQL